MNNIYIFTYLTIPHKLVLLFINTKNIYHTCYSRIYAFQSYIAYGNCYAIYLSRGIAGMYDEYVFTCILFYYGTLKT